MLRTMSSLYVTNFDPAPSSMSKLQPIIHFPRVNPLVLGLKVLEYKYYDKNDKQL